MKTLFNSKSKRLSILILFAAAHLSGCSDSDYDITGYVKNLAPPEVYSYITINLGQVVYFSAADVHISFFEVQQHSSRNSAVLLIIQYSGFDSRYIELNTDIGTTSYYLENGKQYIFYLHSLKNDGGIYTAVLRYNEYDNL